MFVLLNTEIKTLTKRIKKYLFNDSTSILYSSKKDITNDLQKINFDNEIWTSRLSFS